MKVQVQSKKGLQTTLSIVVDKVSIKKELDNRLSEYQKKIDLKGFRKGKVPTLVIKNQFGKAIYGEVIDKILKESTTKAIKDKKLKVFGQPKIDLKTFGEGKDLNFEIKLDLFPEIKLQSFNKISVTDYIVKVDKEELDTRLKNLSKEYKNFENKEENLVSEIGDQVIFDYKATVDGKDFEGSKGEGVTIELGKDLFLKDFDKQLVGVKKMIRRLLRHFYRTIIQKKNWQIKKLFLSVQLKISKLQKKINLMMNLQKNLALQI